MEQKKKNPLKNETYVTSDGKEKRKRATSAQKEMRIQKVAQWLMDGLPSNEVVRKGQEQFGLSQRAVEGYISEANEMIEFISNKELESILAKNLMRLGDVYHNAFDEGDWRNALDAIKTEARMLGLNSPDKFEGKIEGLAEMTAAQREDRLMEIAKRAQRRREGEGLVN